MHKFHVVTILFVLGSLLVSACGGSEAEATPTLSVDQIRTQAVQTFAAGLTETALANPTATSTPTATPTLFATLALRTPLGTTTPGGLISSCYRLVYVKDVSIPDNTPMTPGQTFTKTWEVQNTGSCAWEAGFKFTLVGGDPMSGQTLTLSPAVPVGGATQLSIAMTAPANKTGVIQATWRMSDTQGVYFGDALTVVIVIGGATGVTPAATSVSTETPTPTATP